MAQLLHFKCEKEKYMKKQRLTVSQAKHSSMSPAGHKSRPDEVLWIADIFQITPAGREQLQKVAQQPAL